MGITIHKKKVLALFDKSPVVDAGSIKRIIGEKEYYKQLILNLVRNKDIFRITKGYYSKYDDPALAVYCFQPSYLGLQDAISFHNLWEQETIPIIITQRKVRQGIRKVNGSNILIRRMDKKYLFGFEYEKMGDYYLPYSDTEKTFIDMVYYKENLDKETIKEIKQKIRIPKINRYLKRYPDRIKDKVKGLLLKC